MSSYKTQVEAYLEHQGTKFYERFDANAYVALTRLIDSHDVGRDRGGSAAALATIRAPVLVVGIDSDVLYPVQQQRDLARMIPRATLRIVDSIQGHDGFLLECAAISGLIVAALDAEEGAMETARSEWKETRRQTMTLPRTTSAMNDALAAATLKKGSAPMLSPAQEWFFGI